VLAPHTAETPDGGGAQCDRELEESLDDAVAFDELDALQLAVDATLMPMEPAAPQ